MAPHSSVLAWEIPWTEEPGGLQSLGSQRVGHDRGIKQPQTPHLLYLIPQINWNEWPKIQKNQEPWQSVFSAGKIYYFYNKKIIIIVSLDEESLLHHLETQLYSHSCTFCSETWTTKKKKTSHFPSLAYSDVSPVQWILQYNLVIKIQGSLRRTFSQTQVLFIISATFPLWILSEL